jgi:colicin import membrane protein
MTFPNQLYPEFSREPALFWMIIISIGVHLAVFIGALVLPELDTSRKTFAPVYTVDLVSLPAPASQPSASAPASQAPALEEKAISLPDKAARLPETPAVKEPEPIPIIKKKRSKKIRVKEPPTEKRIEEQLKRLEKDEKKKNTAVAQKSLDQALNRLRAQESGNGSTKGGGQIGLRLQLWKTRVWNKVRGNWSYPEVMAAKDRDFEAVVQVSVTRSGKIRTYKLIRPSGNAVFDQSVIRAVRLSEPFPPFPEGYLKRFDVLELRFTLAELAGSS